MSDQPAALPALLADLQSVCADIYDRWDKDQRSGKLLQALAGTLTEYDPRVTRIRAALAKLSFEKADWFWEVDDPDYSDDSPNSLLWDNCTSFEIMGVAAGIEAGKRWGFFTTDEETDEQTYHWFNTKAEAEAAVKAMTAQAELPLEGE